MFAAIGGLLLWRTSEEHRSVWSSSPKNVLYAQAQIVIPFAVLMVCSGTMCFLVGNGWFFGFSVAWKIVIYSSVGMPFVFLLLFVLSAFVNYISLSWVSRSQIDTVQQMQVLAGLAGFMGLLYGTIFGIVGGNSCVTAMARMREKSYALPVGIVLGLLAGFVNVVLREIGGPRRKIKPKMDDI